MIAGLKSYAAYKDSGQDWLGDIPAHWDHLRAKFLFGEIDERSQTGREELLSVSHITGVTPRSQKNITMFLAKSNVGHKVCRPGDVVINTMWAWMSALGVAKHNGLVSPAYGVYRPLSNDRILPRYADHLLRTPTYASEYLRRSTGVNPSRLRLYPEHFLKVVFVTPPLVEQVSIVRFLDHALQQVDRAIRAKRKTIALLNEQKQAIVHRAITCGIYANVPLRDSCIPWLGHVPAHWDVLRLKWVLRLQRGFDLPADRRRPGTIPVFSSGGHIDNHDVAMASPPGIVIGRYGSTNAAFFVTTPYWPHNTSLFTTTLYDNDPLWCFHLLKTISKGAYAGKSAVPGVDRKDLFDIFVPRPPIAEQVAITHELKNQLADFDKASASITKEIALFIEYRTRLITDVVTGKLDVREAAGRLPETAVDLVAAPTDLPDDNEDLEEPLEEAA